jgi:hypothetical protein
MDHQKHEPKTQANRRETPDLSQYCTTVRLLQRPSDGFRHSSFIQNKPNRITETMKKTKRTQSRPSVPASHLFSPVHRTIHILASDSFKNAYNFFTKQSQITYSKLTIYFLTILY